MDYNRLMEYGSDFNNMGQYFKRHRINIDNLNTFSKFKTACKKIRWKMNDEGNKLFYKYQRAYLQQNGIIEAKPPSKECKITIAGNVVCKLQRIRADGRVQAYWTSLKRAEKIGYKLKIPKRISKKRSVVNQWKIKKK